MPRVPSTDPAATAGRARSHRFPGGNTAVPLWNRDTKQLEATSSFLSTRRILGRCTSLRRQSARDLELRCEVRNAGVGHSFPAGATDSNEAWVEIRVQDRHGAVLFEHERAAVFRTEFVDRDGQPTDRRNTTTEAVAIRSDTVLARGESRPFRYRFQVGRQAAWPLTATLQVKWRKYPRTLMAWLHPDRLSPEIPVTVLASSTTIFEHKQTRSP